ncbi:cytochrome b [Bosea sp. (in: a-proteobacteria)]|jgi:cytochrome b561|uniref:cytochrome b n=1 Tax=Bosea sp. (in: a-proteobacteria) TaxID=1871050 RepID=UPI002DDD098A|nr:cytochrome b [Bosea sp. (in: a-proteobacteria)]HEV2509045.1 cytochrome b [Bosea sp. (in: a-proteobacteria)]
MRPRRWHPLIIVLHWLTLALILVQFGLAQVMRDETRDLISRFQLYQWHKSIGLTVAALVFLRLALRLALPEPQSLALPVWQAFAAASVRAGLYLCLLALPVSGLLMVSAAPIQIPTLLFGWIAVPHPIGPDKAIYEAMLALHEALFTTLAALTAIHAGAALFHQLVLKDGLMRRVWFGRDQPLP